MLAIDNSPSTIRAALDPDRPASISRHLVEQRCNRNQLRPVDQLVRRYTEEEYDIWLGDLSNSRKILGVA
jgi:hypothetical protein